MRKFSEFIRPDFINTHGSHCYADISEGKDPTKRWPEFLSKQTWHDGTPEGKAILDDLKKHSKRNTILDSGYSHRSYMYPHYQDHEKIMSGEDHVRDPHGVISGKHDYSHVTEGNVQALKMYTMHSTNFNKGLIDSKSDSDLETAYANRASHLDHVLTSGKNEYKVPPTMHGSSMNLFHLMDKNKRFKSKGYLSASTDPKVAKGFGGKSILILHPKSEGYKVHPMRPNTDTLHTDEEEVLHPRNIELRPRAMVVHNGKHIWHVDVHRTSTKK